MSQTNYIFEEFSWVSLPPAPLNHSTINSTRSLDGKHIFAFDGTNCSVFSFETLQWSGPYEQPSITIGTGFGLIMTQVDGDLFQIIQTAGNYEVYLFSVMSGYLKTLTNFNGTVFSSDFESYLNRGFFFPPFLFLWNTCCFYVAGYEEYVFYIFSATAGPATLLMVAVKISTGLPAFQFPGGNGDLTFQGEMFNTGLPGTFAARSEGPVYQPGGYVINASDVYENIESAPGVNEFGYLVVNSFLYGNVKSIEPTFGYPTYEITGFYGSITALANVGISSDFLYLLNDNGVPFNYTPFTIAAPNYIIGEFSPGITLPPPEPIPTNEDISRYLTHVQYQNVFGYFLEDYSAGWYLGFGNISFTTYGLKNYMRNDT